MSPDRNPYGLFIHGRVCEGQSSDRIEVRNPGNGELLGTAAVATADEIDEACRSAQQGFEQWRKAPAVERSSIMRQVAAALRHRADELGALLAKEAGKPLNQAVGEINGTAGIIEYYAEEPRRIAGDILPADHADRKVLVMKEPIGVALVISPWNYPVAIMSRALGPALAAGCSVIAKPSSDTPLTVLRVAEVLFEAGLPAGVLNVVTGPGDKVGEALVRHPAVKKVAFTGSREMGKRVMAAGAEGIKHVTLELGGQSPTIVWKDANLKIAVDANVFQGFKCNGEVCNRVNRIYVHEAVAEEFIRDIAEVASRVVMADVFKEGVDIGPMINERQRAHVHSHVQDAVAKGARLECGGQIPTGPEFDRGFFYPATILSNCNHTMRVMTEETFGPVIGIQVVADDLVKAVALANDTPYGLSAFFFGQNPQDMFYAADHFEAGVLYINDIFNTYIQGPYGGFKESGLGRESGTIAVEEFLERKTVYLDLAREHRGSYAHVHRP